MFRETLLECQQAFQPTDIGHPVATPGRKRMTDNLVVPQIHVQRQLIVDTLYIECRHVADDALERAIHIDLGEQQVGINPARLSRLFIVIVFRFALDSRRLAALVSIWI